MAAMAILRQFCTPEGHDFWTEDISIRDLLGSDQVITHSQITDVYLLGLAVHRGGRLATLDQRLPAAAVASGGQALEVITAPPH
jgi:hypothetical protein